MHVVLYGSSVASHFVTHMVRFAKTKNVKLFRKGIGTNHAGILFGVKNQASLCKQLEEINYQFITILEEHNAVGQQFVDRLFFRGTKPLCVPAC